MRFFKRLSGNEKTLKATQEGRPLRDLGPDGILQFSTAKLDKDAAMVIDAANCAGPSDHPDLTKLRRLLVNLSRDREHSFFEIDPAQIGNTEPAEWLLRAALSCFSDDQALLGLIVRKLGERNKTDLCREVLSKFLETSPESAAPLVECLHLDIAAQKRDHVEAALSKVFPQLSSSPQLALRTISLLQSIGENRMRLDLCEQASARFPDRADLRLQEAYCLADMGRTDDGDRVFDEICQAFPGSASVAAIARRYIQRGQYERALSILDTHIDSASPDEKVRYAAMQIEAYVRCDDLTAAAHIIALRFPEETEKASVWQIAQLLKARGDWSAALRHLDAYIDVLGDKQPPAAVTALRAEIECSIQTSDLIEAVPLAKPLRGVCVMISLGSSNSLVWKGLTMAELRKQGFASIVLEESMLRQSPTGDPEIDRFHGCIRGSQIRLRDEPLGPIKLRNKWIVDIAAEVVEANGLNLFQPIRERVSTVQRRYSVNFDDTRAKEVVDEMILKADLAMSVFDDIRKTLGAKGLPVRFLGSMSHYCPSAVYKKLCALNEGPADLGYVAFLVAYQHYYTVMGNTLSSALSVKNLTKTKVRMPHKPTREEFLDWVDRQDRTEEHLARARELTMADRGRVQDSPERAQALDRIKAHRAKGGRVVCLFGKLTYDIGADREGGPGHKDMADWARHSVESVRGHDDILLLIKPHPNELRRELNRPTELFFDLLPENLPPNVMPLNHRWFNNKDLIPLIDLGTIWHGTAILELMTMKVPILACSWTGMTDNPITPLSPKDRTDYEHCLRHPKDFVVSDEEALHAGLTIIHMSTDDLMIPYEYGHMPFLRGMKNHKPTHWFPDKLTKYVQNGDPHIEALASRVI